MNTTRVHTTEPRPQAGNDLLFAQSARRAPLASSGLSAIARPASAPPAERLDTSTEPFHQLLRQLQESAQPGPSRLNEPAASEMFEPGRNETTSQHDRDQGPNNGNETRTHDSLRTRHAERTNRSPERNPNLAETNRRPASEHSAPSAEQAARSTPNDTNHRSSTVAHTTASADHTLPPTDPSQRPSSAPSSRGATEQSRTHPSVSAGSQAQTHSGGRVIPSDSALDPNRSAAPSQPSARGMPSNVDAPNASGSAGRLVVAFAELIRGAAQPSSKAIAGFERALADVAVPTKEQPFRLTPDASPEQVRTDALPSPKADPAARHSWFDPFVRSLRISGGAAHSSATIRLSPPELGALTVSVQTVADRIRIAVRTETIAAADRIRAALADLNAAMASRGLTVEALTVDVIGANTTRPGEATAHSTARSTVRPSSLARQDDQPAVLARSGRYLDDDRNGATIDRHAPVMDSAQGNRRKQDRNSHDRLNLDA